MRHFFKNSHRISCDFFKISYRILRSFLKISYRTLFFRSRRRFFYYIDYLSLENPQKIEFIIIFRIFVGNKTTKLTNYE